MDRTTDRRSFLRTLAGATGAAGEEPPVDDVERDLLMECRGQVLRGQHLVEQALGGRSLPGAELAAGVSGLTPGATRPDELLVACAAAAMASHGIPGDHTDPCTRPDPPAHCRWANNHMGDR